MTGTPLDIIGLASLASTAARSLGRAVGGQPATPFADLLKKAQGETEATGLPVGLGKGVNVELTSDQLQRLSIAADRAESQGAQTAVVMIDGRALELDVTLRQITGEVDPAQGIKPEIDTFLFAPSGDEQGPKLPGSGAHNPSLLRLLADQNEAASR